MDLRRNSTIAIRELWNRWTLATNPHQHEMAARTLFQGGRKITQKSIVIGDRGTDMTYLSTLFERARTDSIVVDGRRIHGILRIRVEVPSLLRVRRLHASSDPVPGLQIKMYDGTATLEGEKVPNLIIWSDMSPAERELHIIPKRKKTAEVRIWHVWRGYMVGHAVTQAWVLNEGMLVEQSDNSWVLRCNSGPNESLSFDDLIVEVRLTPQARP